MMPQESETVTRIGHRTQPKVILRLESIQAVWARIVGRRILSCLLIVASRLVLRLALLKIRPDNPGVAAELAGQSSPVPNTLAT
jgi:hypothetical protein